MAAPPRAVEGGASPPPLPPALSPPGARRRHPDAGLPASFAPPQRRPRRRSSGRLGPEASQGRGRRAATRGGSAPGPRAFPAIPEPGCVQSPGLLQPREDAGERAPKATLRRPAPDQAQCFCRNQPPPGERCGQNCLKIFIRDRLYARAPPRGRKRM
ncbi:laminin subunit beta-1 variant-like isoform X2 [Erinaceus europaeus]|uniref:Laminin subunit beta-1 variant-like isoform X2 n=1 Tax=Erinaceus europaeus TaxID=9365 RepID=A0ABM3YEZ1_ERIEU|nr:laminin subunit beta-1 variant-like isoform X2 [Erinaceus europaeus]